MKDHLPNNYLRPTVAFDFDGTLNVDSHEYEPGLPREDVCDLVARLRSDGWYVVVHSARPPTHHPVVTAWLDRHGVPHDQVALGTKPSVDVYVDDKGLFPPLDALHEFIERRRQSDPLEALARGTSPTDFAHDIADTHENPKWTGRHGDDDFRVVVPLSGGMDSLTCWRMSTQAGYPTVPVYVSTGAPYTEKEIAVCRALVGDDLIVLRCEQNFVTYDYIDLGRNPIILWAVADFMAGEGWWGEIPFGNTADWSETPIRGGDKSLRFFGTMQALLTLEGRDVRVTNPVAGMNKADIVTWWAARGDLDVIRQARSCYSATEGHCGRCRCCFKRWLAFEASGYNTDGMWPNGTDWTEWIEDYRECCTWESATMAPSRRAYVDLILEGQ